MYSSYVIEHSEIKEVRSRHGNDMYVISTNKLVQGIESSAKALRLTPFIQGIFLMMLAP